MDYFGARYYSSPQGRFTSVDPGSTDAELSNPQSCNAYSYARNNPLLYIDPDGFQSRPFGRATLKGYRPPRGGAQAFDPSVVLVPTRVHTLDDPVWKREGYPNPSQGTRFFNPNVPTAEGYGILGAVAPYEEHNVDLVLSLRLEVDKEKGVTNAFIDISMGWSISSDQRPTISVWEPFPGAGQPPPEVNNVNINTSTLAALSDVELQAVASAGARTPTGPYAPIGKAIIQAVIDEQARRAERDKKRKQSEEEED